MIGFRYRNRDGPVEFAVPTIFRLSQNLRYKAIWRSNETVAGDIAALPEEMQERSSHPHVARYFRSYSDEVAGDLPFAQRRRAKLFARLSADSGEPQGVDATFSRELRVLCPRKTLPIYEVSGGAGWDCSIG
jgi:hypothetical protein